MRYSSVECTVVVPRRLRRRLGRLVWARCRRPAEERNTLPVAVILNRFAADFLVLMPLGRRIKNESTIVEKERAIYEEAVLISRGFFCSFAKVESSGSVQ